MKLCRPLDWIAVTDHSDGMGVISELKAGNPELMADAVLKRWHDMMLAGPEQAAAATMELINAQSNKQLPAGVMDPKFAKSVWLKNNAIMEKYNEPGPFTAFIAYEWTSNAGGGDNLHRNVIYRDGSDKADQMIPYTTFQSENPEDLWKWMANWEDKTGGSLLAIPHNGNLSNGRMFELKTFTGQPLTKEWAEERARWEPLFEVIQTKGQSESHPVALADRRVRRRLRAVGQGQPQSRAQARAGHDPVRICARGAEERPQARAGARRQPVQVRHCLRQRRPHRPRPRWKRTTIFCKFVELRAAPRAVERGRHEIRRPHGEGLGGDCSRLHRRMGDRKHARSAL